MKNLRDLAIEIILSLILLCSLFNTIQTEHHQHSTKYTTTTTTKQPFIRTPGLSLPQRNKNPPKCYKEVPAIFFQYEKDVLVRGNSSTYFNLIEVCCEGYKRYDFDWSKCVPDCGKKCQRNGFCLEGGICKCFDEFVLNHRNDCVPTCPLECPNGQCYVNGTCICNKGYELDATKKYCVPLCELGCGSNEICDAPNKCICAEGYAKSVHPDMEKMGCQPVCIPDCGFGHCVAPNKCECFHGYEKRRNRSVCERNCYLSCENGICADRGHIGCICQVGYKYDSNTTSCLPYCGDTCENGVCIAPGVCRCFNGYQRNGQKCEAICEHGCGFYGKCIAPGVCGCAIIDGPFKSYQKCPFGYCNSKGRCRCHVGTTRFINQCFSPDKITTYASINYLKLNEALVDEFNLLIGSHFKLANLPVYGLYN